MSNCRWFFVLSALAAAVVGCSSSNSGHGHASASDPSSLPASTPTSSSDPSTSTAPTTTPASSEHPDPTGPAIAAYLRYRSIVNAVDRTPSSTRLLNELAAITVDPQQGTDGRTLLQYRLNHLVWRGTPPRPRASVTESRLEAKPYPTVVVRDCPTASASWKPYDTTENKPVPVQYPKGSAHPPFAITATVVDYKSHWVVAKVTTYMRKTCAP